MSTTGTDVAQRVRAAVEAVPDPELPPVTLGMLGMVAAVDVEGDTARIVLLPTWVGCPAQEMMGRDVTAAAGSVAGVEVVEVEWSFDPVWTPQRITPEGHERLRSFGIAPPRPVTAGGPVAGDRRSLPVVADVRPCPYCGSEDTKLDAAFGPTPCRDVRYCNTCRQPFEAFKPH